MPGFYIIRYAVTVAQDSDVSTVTAPRPYTGRPSTAATPGRCEDWPR